jgi:hypothetical protein
VWQVVAVSAGDRFALAVDARRSSADLGTRRANTSRVLAMPRTVCVLRAGDHAQDGVITRR